jgi:hypothetical protein
VTDYTDLAAVKADLGIDNTDDDTAISAAISAASRAIDRATGTTFSATTEARLFTASRGGGTVYVDRFTDPTGLVVKTGSGGTYDTTIDAADYVLWPYSAPARGLAYYRIDVPGRSFGVEAGRPTVEVTAAWGWDYVPDDIELATRLKAIHLYHRREAPHGRASYADDSASSEVTYGPDPDVASLLAPYIPIGIR